MQYYITAYYELKPDTPQELEILLQKTYERYGHQFDYIGSDEGAGVVVMLVSSNRVND